MGEIKANAEAIQEMSDIAGNKKNLKFVDNYNALTSILSQLENNLLSSIEGGSNTFFIHNFFSFCHILNHLGSPLKRLQL